MVAHDKKVLSFLLSYEASQMTRKDVDVRIREMKKVDWKKHLRMQKPDGTCRSGCPLHSSLS
ncbi:MAG: hypothetical protein HY059_17965 [Proteobacteria bacterium]|nr:hypothetical protein [Pseudomonadota bacterium]